MPRLPQLNDPESATPAAHLLEATHRQLGRLPNLYRTMANSPAALAGYLAFRAALVDGVLTVALREQLALLIAELNSCGYCVAAHHLRASKLGLSPDELTAIRSARHHDPHTQAAPRFAAAVATDGGDVTDHDLAAARAGGLTDAELAEVVAHVALNIYSNYFNHVAQPELDFPPVELLAAAVPR